jgi:hypothetical protein
MLGEIRRTARNQLEVAELVDFNVSRREDKPAANFATRQALVGVAAIGKRYHAIDHGGLEGSIVKQRRKSLKQRRRCDRIRLTRIDSEQLALFAIKIHKVEADPAVADRCDLHQSAAMP